MEPDDYSQPHSRYVHGRVRLVRHTPRVVTQSLRNLMTGVDGASVAVFDDAVMGRGWALALANSFRIRGMLCADNALEFVRLDGRALRFGRRSLYSAGDVEALYALLIWLHTHARDWRLSLYVDGARRPIAHDPAGFTRADGHRVVCADNLAVMARALEAT